MMSVVDNNWQLASNINIANEWRLFIREYQSSPTELFVSAINERLEKQGAEAATQNSNLKDNAQIKKILDDSNRKHNQLHGRDDEIEEDI
jgi:hypothetical protein